MNCDVTHVSSSHAPRNRCGISPAVIAFARCEDTPGGFPASLCGEDSAAGRKAVEGRVVAVVVMAVAVRPRAAEGEGGHEGWWETRNLSL